MLRRGRASFLVKFFFGSAGESGRQPKNRASNRDAKTVGGSSAWVRVVGEREGLGKVEKREKARQDAPSDNDRWPGREYFLQVRFPRGAVHNELRDLGSREEKNGPPVRTAGGRFTPSPSKLAGAVFATSGGPTRPTCSIRTGFPLMGPRTRNFNLGLFCTPRGALKNRAPQGSARGFGHQAGTRKNISI